MSDITQSPPPQGSENVPPWRDGRVLGVLAQILFVVFIVYSLSWIWQNIQLNLFTLGESQFICEDGTSQVRCAFDFLSSDAQFNIAESVISYSSDDSFWRAIAVGALNTLKVAVFGIILATLLGTATGIARLSQNWFIRTLAGWYIDLMRNTPLLLQLFFLYFIVLLPLPPVEEAFQIFNIPLYLSQRGINYPSVTFLSGFPAFFAFVVLGIVQAQLLWSILGRRERETGQEYKRGRWAVFSFLVVVGLGWFVAANNTDSEAMMVARALRVREVSDFEALAQRNYGISNLGRLDDLIESGEISSEEFEAGIVRLCTIMESPSEVNLTGQLRRLNVPYQVSRFERADQVTEAYAAGNCDAYVAGRSILAAERDLLEDSDRHLIVSVPEVPARISVPILEGFNFFGGARFSLEFTAILLGLVIYTAAFIAEIVRAGILSVPGGQSEAARALGLNESQRLQLVVLPQALRVIIPPMISQYLNLTKNSSLAAAVLFPDLYQTVNTIINQSGRSVQLVLILAAIYLSFSLIISMILNWYNQRIALVER